MYIFNQNQHELGKDPFRHVTLSGQFRQSKRNKITHKRRIHSIELIDSDTEFFFWLDPDRLLDDNYRLLQNPQSEVKRMLDKINKG
jgi:hypothetical protein